jgi:integrase/recombinase XerD
MDHTAAARPVLRVLDGQRKQLRSTLDEPLMLFLSQYDAPTTRRAYGGEVERLFRWLGHHDPARVTTGDLLRYRSDKSALAPATRHRILVTIRRFFGFAKHHGFIDGDPSTNIRLPTVHATEPEILSQAEAELLLRIPDCRSLKGRRDRTILALALINGLRVSEICGLNLGDRKERYGRPALRIRGKGSKERVLPLSLVEQEAIESYLKLRRGPSEPESPLLLTVKGDRHRITRKVVAGVIESCGKKALISGKCLSPHILRHSAFSLELQAGADIKKISRQAGHSSLSVTARYLHQLEGVVEPAVDSNPLGRDE